MKKNLLAFFSSRNALLGFLCLTCISISKAQSNGDFRTKSSGLGAFNSGTWEVYDATTGVWTATTDAPAGKNCTIRDGHTLSSNSTNSIGSLTVGEGNGAILSANVVSGGISSINITDPGKLNNIPALAIVSNTGTGAAASISTVNVTGVSINNPGSGYTSAPTITFSAAPGGGTTATGTAVVDISTGRITDITITNPGSGYTSVPTITIGTDGGGSGASITAKVGITGINLTSGGSNYTDATSVIAGTYFVPGSTSATGTTRTVTITNDLTFKKGSAIIIGNLSTSAGSVAQNLTIGGDLITSSDITFYTVPYPNGSATVSFTKPTATISGTGSVNFRNLTIGSTTTLAINTTVSVAGTVNLNTSGKIDASSGSVSYIAFPPTPIALTIASGTFVNNSIKNLTINNTSGVTTNSDLTVTNTLTQKAGIFTIPVSKTLKITSGNAIAGTFGSTSYINTASDAATGTTGIVQLENISSARTLPLGNNSNYLPVTITPSVASAFAVNVFTGATENGTANGAATTDKTKLVDAIYTVNRVSGSGSAQLTLGFPSSLKGSGFTSNSFGISRFNGSNWDAVTGTGDNSSNTATASYSNFSPFRVEWSATVLPVKLTSFAAQTTPSSIEVKWATSSEENSDKFVVEKSTDGASFTTLTEVKSKGPSSYSVIDNTPTNGTNYYRLVQFDHNGSSTVYGPVSANFTISSASFAVYPNPSTGNISFNTDGLLGNAKVVLSDLQGRVVYSENAQTTSNAYSLNVKSLAAGQYVLSVSSNGVKKISKVIML